MLTRFLATLIPRRVRRLVSKQLYRWSKKLHRWSKKLYFEMRQADFPVAPKDLPVRHQKYVEQKAWPVELFA